MVDDDEGIRRIVGIQLKRLGFQIDYAIDGSEAVQKAKSKQYSIIVMDINMPVMDGMEAIKEIRSAEIIEDKWRAAIIAISSDENLLPKALKAGADDALLKPFDYKRLEEVVSLWC